MREISSWAGREISPGFAHDLSLRFAVSQSRLLVPGNCAYLGQMLGNSRDVNNGVPALRDSPVFRDPRHFRRRAGACRRSAADSAFCGLVDLADSAVRLILRDGLRRCSRESHSAHT